MKYYKLINDGIVQILETYGGGYDNLKQNFCFEENEVIKTRYLIKDQDSLKLNFTVFTNSNRPLTMDAHLEMKGGYLTNSVDIILDDFKHHTLEEVHKHAEDLVFNKDFIFSRDKEIYDLKENIQYIEITEKEYRDNKVKENFK